MFMSAETLRLLMESGLPQEKVLEIYRALEADFRALQSAQPVETAAEKRRAYDRERKRAKRNSTGLSTGHDDKELSANSTGLSTGIPPDNSPYARGEDNLSRLVVAGNHTTPKTHERDFDNRADLDWLEGQLREAGGPAIASQAVAPGMGMLGPILALLRADPPCLLDVDVLPAIRARCAKSAPGSIRSWAYFRDAICQARDARLTEAPKVASLADYRPTGPPRTPGERANDARQEATRRVLESLEDEA
jgi:hypothetical protein